MTASKAKYRIQAVAEMTGVPASTLRSWERRYGVPAPERTQSSYRLYSDEDIDRIAAVRRLCDAGVAPAQAVRMALEGDAPPPSIDEAPSARTEASDAGSESIVATVEAFDPIGLEASTRAAILVGTPAAAFEQVIAPALRVIETRWYEGTLSVAQTHMATEILGHAARDLLRLAQPQPVRNTAVLACFADEDFDLPLVALAFPLASWGIRACMLGARTPPSAVAETVERLGPALVGLSVTMPPPPHRARELVEGYAAASQGRPWVVGGKGADSIRPIVEAHGGLVVESPRELQQVVAGF